MLYVSQIVVDGTMAIPWEVMPHHPQTGDQIRFNVLVYNRDADNPDIGRGYGKSREGWGSVVATQQAPTYLWPKVTLE